MSGTTNGINGPQNLIAGIGTASIDGTLYNISDVTYSDTVIIRESQVGYNGYHGQSGKYAAAFIAFKVRDNSGIKVSDFAGMVSSTVMITLANGKVVTGSTMGCTLAREVDANTGEFEARFEGPGLTGT